MIGAPEERGRADVSADVSQLPHEAVESPANSVNGEMGDFGGVIVSLNGKTHNLVRDYDAAYVRRTHRGEVARALRGWDDFLTAGRDYRLVLAAAWDHPSMPFDAHFNDDFFFYFRSRDEMTRFRAGHRSTGIMRRVGREWKRVRLR